MKKIFTMLLPLLIIAALLSGCAQRKYEKALDILTGYTFEDKFTALEKAGDYGDAQEILDMLKKLYSCQYQEASDAYFSYTESGGTDIDLFKWAGNVSHRAESLQNDEILEFARACYRPILAQEWDDLSSIYESLKFNCMNSFYLPNAISGVHEPEECGTTADGSVAIYVNDSRTRGRTGFAIGLMSFLPERFYPGSFDAIEYIIF